MSTTYRFRFDSINKTLAVVLLLALLIGLPKTADAAYCSLRDPIIAIQTMYPKATQHRSIVRPIDQNIRREIAKLLPFTLHYKEVGRHTLYLVNNERKPIGFVQARSEASDWGLVEIAWAISPDMTIDGMVLQRCRGPECNAALKNQVQHALYGKSFPELLTLLSADGNALSNKAKNTIRGAQPLLLTILRSALKTLAVTQLVWGDVVGSAQSTPDSQAAVAQ
ncbi:MAG: hypothetical protein ACR2PS_11000 [Pseudomonadales bacterium]